MKHLFSTYQLGRYTLKNRIVMAPMTRSRAIGNVPNDLMAAYYGARADAGLIITEGTSPSANGLGYSRIPGIFSSAQVEGWQKVTQAVHQKGGHIFLQVMHTGRVSHALNMPAGAQVLAPSAIQLAGDMWTDQEGMKPHPTPKAMTLEDIQRTKAEYVHAAKLAIQAGFDGIELHAANGYLLEQFLNPKSNQRQDEYGTTPEGRSRFLLEIARETTAAIGADRVGLRISPYGVFNDMGPFPGVDDFYATLALRMRELGLAYIHVVDHSAQGAPPVPDEVKRRIRESFKGPYILSGGYDADRAESDLVEGKGELVAFGRPFLGNADLVSRLRERKPLQNFDPNTLYTPGAKGYTEL